MMNKSVDNPEAAWPSDISENFVGVMKSLLLKCKKLSLRILSVLGIGLKLVGADELVKRHSSFEPKRSRKLISYSAVCGLLCATR